MHPVVHVISVPDVDQIPAAQVIPPRHTEWRVNNPAPTWGSEGRRRGGDG